MSATSYEATYLALGACMGAGVPVILWGPPGQGKTSVIRDLAAAQGRALEIILASIREPQDFAGLPVVSGDSMRLVAPDWARRLAAVGTGILFLDEVNTAPPSVQAALLRVSLDRVAGDCYLGDGTSVVAAANPPEIAADGWDLAPPLANRFCHLPWELPTSVVRAGFAGSWPRYDITVPDQESVAAAAQQELLWVGGFLSAKPQVLTVVPGSATEQGRSFPTPRSWEMTARLLGWASAAQLPPEVHRVLAVGCVGQGAAVEYLTFRDNLDLPDIEELLSDPAAVRLPKRADQLYVLLGGTMLAVELDCTEQRWAAAGEVLARVARGGAEDTATAFGPRWMAMRPEGAALSPDLVRTLLPIARAGRVL